METDDPRCAGYRVVNIKTLKISESSRNDVTRMAMQTMVSTAKPHQTAARRCVTVRAMKSLMRMSKRIQHESARRFQSCRWETAVSDAFDTNAIQLPLRSMSVRRLCETLVPICSSP